jgi:threonine/homoserine/homoserine lactone efflux protein
MFIETSAVLLFISTAILLTIAPGPDIIYVAIRGISQGWKAGLVAALGLVTGIFVHIMLAALGLSAILQSSPILFTIIKYAGTAYLIYIGWQIYRSGPVGIENSNSRPSLGAIYRQTILMNILNPKVALFFLAFLPQFVDTQSPHATFQMAVFGFIFQAIALVIMGGTGLLAGYITSKFTDRSTNSTWLTKISGTGVMSLGVFIPIKDLWDHLSEI